MADKTQEQEVKVPSHLGQCPPCLAPGEKRPVQSEESIGHHAERGVVVEASPAAASGPGPLRPSSGGRAPPASAVLSIFFAIRIPNYRLTPPLLPQEVVAP